MSQYTTPTPAPVNLTQLNILLSGLSRIHPDLATRLRATFERVAATLDTDSEAYGALVADLATTVRGTLHAECHADSRFTGFGACLEEK